MTAGAAEIILLLGTRKGAFFLQANSERKRWMMKGPFFKNSPVFHMCFDERDGKTIYAAVNSGHFGPTIQRTKNFGRTWENSSKPPRFHEGSELKVENIWHIESGPPDEPNVVLAGVAPAALFRSEDNGDTWTINEGLNNHPTRLEWQPGAGGLCLHSIVHDPSNQKRLYVGISAVGVFKSEDGGESWSAKNRNVRADFLSTKYPEYGQCVHKLVMDPKHPNHLYQQNHCGVYRSEDAGENWTEISKGLPSGFGFPMVSHPTKSGTIFVVPEEGDDFRVASNQEFAVYGTTNGGRSWRKHVQGLPTKNAYLGCYREGLTADHMDPVGLYVATRTGQLFSSLNQGKNWQRVAQWLPPIYSVSTATTRPRELAQ